MRRRLLLHLVAAATLIALSCFPARAEETIVIRDVTVVDVESGSALEGRRVRIEGERIAAVEPESGQAIEEGARLVEGKGMVLIPGLFDCHVHYVDPGTYGPLLIAHGVTFVRDMGGATDDVLARRDRLNAGDELGPEMIATGAIIDGKPPVWPFSEACETPEEGRAAVRKLVEKGVDQIKVYSLLKKDVHRAVLEEAHELGKVAVGHVPGSVGLLEAAETGQRCAEHLIGWERVLQRLAGQPPASPGDFAASFQAWSELPRVDRDALRDEIRKVADRKMFHCPTLVVMLGIGKTADDAAASDPRLDYVPEGLRSFWNSGRYGFGAAARDVFPMMKRMVHELRDGGVPLLVGTDLANPNVFAGSSVHEEMSLFQEAGIPAVEVLQAATIVPSRFFGVADRLGTIAPGKVASLVLLRKDPLADIRNTQEIEAVFLRGRYFSRKDLDGLLDDVRAQVAGEQPAEGTVDLSVPGEVIHRGVYASTFNGMSSGTETFVISRTSEGYHLKAHVVPKGFGQPSLTVMRLDTKGNILENRWIQLTSKPIEARYTLENGTATAEATLNGQKLPTQTLDVPEDTEISGPSLASQFFDGSAEGLAVGETKKYNSLGYGFPSWQMALAPAEVTRKPDETVSWNGKEIRARFYDAIMTSPMGQFENKIWTLEEGLVLKMRLKMPFGTIETVLEPTESSPGG